MIVAPGAIEADPLRSLRLVRLACELDLNPDDATREAALTRYDAFSQSHERKFRWLLNTQRAVGRLTPSRAITVMARALTSERACSWLFNRYLDIAPPSFVNVDQGPGSAARRVPAHDTI